MLTLNTWTFSYFVKTSFQIEKKYKYRKRPKEKRGGEEGGVYSSVYSMMQLFAVWDIVAAR